MYLFHKFHEDRFCQSLFKPRFCCTENIKLFDSISDYWFFLFQIVKAKWRRGSLVRLGWA